MSASELFASKDLKCNYLRCGEIEALTGKICSFLRRNSFVLRAFLSSGFFTMEVILKVFLTGDTLAVFGLTFPVGFK